MANLKNMHQDFIPMHFREEGFDLILKGNRRGNSVLLGKLIREVYSKNDYKVFYLPDPEQISMEKFIREHTPYSYVSYFTNKINIHYKKYNFNINKAYFFSLKKMLLNKGKAYTLTFWVVKDSIVENGDTSIYALIYDNNFILVPDKLLPIK